MLSCKWYFGSSVFGVVDTAAGGATIVRRSDRRRRPAIPAPARERLRAIFGGDEARVDALIEMGLASLRKGVAELADAIDSQDRAWVARTAHGLKGIAMEIGFRAIADRGAVLEKAASAADWTIVVGAYRDLADALRCEIPSVFGLTDQSDKSRE